ncbi:phage antirepressor [Lactobacillus iners]|uniref:phage antirepressor n=1 Tax=Lactobacillus iners TaxID=147802 RepID=UPI0013E1AAC2|nr:phage antirepressor KilAC domain-containing protein [Lactobacillus iners]QIH26226.1 phage repressor protein/antirepressor Ant [Lactobacillus iners]
MIDNKIQIFNFENNEIRALNVGGQPYFVGKDVADILGYTNSSKALADHVDEEDKLNNDSLLSLGQRGGWLINESGLYSLILSSKMPNAKKFKRWVTSEVLPAIVHKGVYMTDKKAYDITHDRSGATLADLLQQAADQLKQKDIQIAEMKPKALFADAVATSNRSILVGELAKLIRQNGVDIGQNRLFIWLREHGYLIKRKGTDYNMPTQKSVAMGIFQIKETSITHSNGTVTLTKTAKVTGKGQQYFINKFLCSQRVLPVIERS